VDGGFVQGPGSENEPLPDGGTQGDPDDGAGDAGGPVAARPTAGGRIDDASAEVRGYEEAFKAYRAGDHKGAIDRFRSFLQTYPSSAYADNALFWLGECYLKTGDHERAVLAFEDVVKKHPNGGKVPDALYRQGVALLELGEQRGQKKTYQRAARELFERIIRDHPNSERVPEARLQLERLGT
jgi:tol-pal system protein YbgF